MGNVEYVCSRKRSLSYTMEYLFKIKPNIADMIREYTKYSKGKLRSCLTDDNEVIFRTGSLADEKTEWWTAHFFINLSCIIFSL